MKNACIVLDINFNKSTFLKKPLKKCNSLINEIIVDYKIVSI